MLGSELWEEDFYSLLSLVKEYIVDVWESRKVQLYGNDSCPSIPSLHSAGNLGEETTGKSGKLSDNCTCVRSLMGGFAGGNNMNVHGNNSSAHCHGCVVDGSFAMAAC